jgi:hypothetical protein
MTERNLYTPPETRYAARSSQVVALDFCHRWRTDSDTTITDLLLNHEERFTLNGGESDVQNL